MSNLPALEKMVLLYTKTNYSPFFGKKNELTRYQEIRLKRLIIRNREKNR